jgi:hypothetical protein
MSPAMPREATIDHSVTLHLFFYLQVLDLMTTLLGFKLGLAEASPFVRWLTSFGPEAGVVASKLIAVALGAFAVWTQRFKVIRWINYWFAALVAWNLWLILIAGRIS